MSENGGNRSRRSQAQTAQDPESGESAKQLSSSQPQQPQTTTTTTTAAVAAATTATATAAVPEPQQRTLRTRAKKLKVVSESDEDNAELGRDNDSEDDFSEKKLKKKGSRQSLRSTAAAAAASTKEKPTSNKQAAGAAGKGRGRPKASKNAYIDYEESDENDNEDFQADMVEYHHRTSARRKNRNTTAMLAEEDAASDDEEYDGAEEKPLKKLAVKHSSRIQKNQSENLERTARNGRGNNNKAKESADYESSSTKRGREIKRKPKYNHDDDEEEDNDQEEHAQGFEGQDDQEMQEEEDDELDVSDEEDDYDSDDKANKVQRDEEYNLSETDANESWCFICREQGKLICCENCSKTFHMNCVGIKKPPSGQWECPYCSEMDIDICCACQTSTAESKISVTCSLCYRQMHFECLGITLKQLVDCPMNRSYFLDAETLAMLQQFNQKDHSDANDQKEKLDELEAAIRKLHVEQGRQIMYSCFTCLSYFGIDKIEDIAPAIKGSCFISKLKNAAYLHSYWVQESVIEKKVARKLKNFKDKKKWTAQVPEDDEEMEMGEGGSLEDRSGLLDDNIKIERIIDCKRSLTQAEKPYSEIYDMIFNQPAEVYENQLRFGSKSNLKFLVKWHGLFYEESTFEDEFVIFKYKNILKQFLKLKMFEEVYGTPQFEEERQKKRIIENPPAKRHKNQQNFITGGWLHKFQIDGVGWLAESYNKQNNVILADEMGLGKTVQSVSFLNFLFYEKNIDGPFMIVTPASTLYNWLREFQNWGQQFNVLVYAGNQHSRSLIRQREFYFKLKNRKPSEKNKKKSLVPKFNALITSYDTAINDAHFLRKMKWECLIVDEAHRLKNNESKFFKISSTIPTKHKVLLTGTPLQNNILELLNLIEFICPVKAKTMKNFESLKMFLTTTSVTKSSAASNDEQIPEEERKKALNELTKMLGPHLLRRKKTDVDLDLPEMEEIIVKISLTDTQKYYYKNVLVKNYDNLKLLDNKSRTNLPKISLLNILMSLRLVCNHPFLFLYKKKYSLPRRDKFQEEFIDCSNKLKFLERMIPKLLAQNHKMLIFSQFTMMLDILGEFFAYKGWSCERLDGTTSVIDRQKTIDSFNSKESKSKIFLLSTRAGGLGINLTSADTIFFTDSDFNPYRDVQAISRAYRMGQESKVKVYRLVSKFSAEERIIEIATRKLLLESIIINPINKLTKEDFETILKNGTYEMFNKNLEEKDQEFTDEQIDALIRRDTAKGDEADVENVQLVKSDLNDYYLSGFKFNSYNFETIDERQKNADQDQDEQKEKDQKRYWETLLDDQAKLLQFETTNELGKGKRVRKMINTQLHNDHMKSSDSQSEFDADHNDQNKSGTESDAAGDDEVAEPGAKKNASGHSNKPPQQTQNTDDATGAKAGAQQKHRRTSDKILKYFDDEIYNKSQMKQADVAEIDRFSFMIHSFSEFHRIDFLSFILEFGMDFNSIDQFWSELLKHRSQTFKRDQRPNISDFKKYLKEFYAALFFFKRLEKQDNAVFGGLQPELIVRRITGLSLMRKKHSLFQKRPDKFKISHKEYQPHQSRIEEGNFRVEFERFKWTNTDDYLIVHGIFNVGFGNWENLISNKILWDFPSDATSEPIWKILFTKFNEKPLRDDINQEVAQKWVLKRIENRANNIMNYLLDSEDSKKED